MTVEAKNLPAITPTGEPWEPKTLEVLTAYPEAQFNLLIPTVSVRQINPFLVPDIEVVQLDVSDGSRDIYHSNDMKANQYAPTASALRKVADVAGITEVSSVRVDDGKDPDVVEWTVAIERQLPSGQVVRSHGSKRMDLKAMHFASDAHKRRQREFILEHAQTKALNRAIRSQLSLHGSYPKATLARPFAILRWMPDMRQPEVRDLFLQQLSPTATRLFGGNGEPKHIEQQAEVVTAPEAPEEDAAPERPANVDEDGVKIEEPDWGTSSDPAPTATDEPPEPPEPRILVALKERVDASEAKGPATAEQKEQLKTATTGIGQEAVMRVLAALWSLKAPADITRAQADAILDEAEQRTAFVADWRAAAVWLKESQAT